MIITIHRNDDGSISRFLLLFLLFASLLQLIAAFLVNWPVEALALDGAVEELLCERRDFHPHPMGNLAIFAAFLSGRNRASTAELSSLHKARAEQRLANHEESGRRRSKGNLGELLAQRLPHHLQQEMGNFMAEDRKEPLVYRGRQRWPGAGTAPRSGAPNARVGR
jgi:hypothetical protein